MLRPGELGCREATRLAVLGNRADNRVLVERGRARVPILAASRRPSALPMMVVISPQDVMSTL